MINKKNVTFEDVQKEQENLRKELIRRNRQDVQFAVDQTGGYPFNAQFFYPEYDKLDTIESEDDIINKLTR